MVNKRLVWLLVVAAVLLVVVPAFAQDQMMTYTVMTGSNADLGSFLVDSNGMTLYMFTADTPGATTCTDQCATNWPPLTVDQGTVPSLAPGVPGELKTIQRADGASQVVYDGMPLYYFAKDTAAGDVMGQGVGDKWYVVAPPMIGLGSNPDISNYLVGSNGMTLYIFNNDTEGVSNCYDQCATNWPPLTVDSMDAVPTTLPGLPGDVSVIERTDMTYQVAYNGMPLYYFVKDTAPGDAVGQGVNNVWWVVQPPTVNLSNNADLGDFVVGPDGMTLYTFTNDTENTSNCYDKCAVNWPPLLVAPGETPSAGDGVMGDLGTTERTDGATQVTYNGMPLYYYIKDVVPGDTVGQNVGEKWFVTH